MHSLSASRCADEAGIVGAPMQITTQIDISAPAQRVWQILTDLPSYCEWNPFMPQGHGDVQIGNKVEVHVLPPGATGMVFVLRILEAEEPRKLRWCASFLCRGLFDTDCIFSIESTEGGGVRLHQYETYSGILLPIMRKFLRQHTRAGFESMLQSLKDRAEQV